MPATRSDELATAVKQARELARGEGREGAVVLLSPACASFDQFTNFEARGDAFRDLVEALPGTRSDPDIDATPPSGALAGGSASQ